MGGVGTYAPGDVRVRGFARAANSRRAIKALLLP